MIISHRYILAGIIAMVLILTSCEENLSSDENSEDIIFAFESRAGSDEGAFTAGSTYTICTYSSSNYSLMSSGTFYLESEDDTKLTPCIIDEDGNITESDNTIGRTSTTRYLFIISPALNVNDDGSFNIKLGDIFYAPEKGESISLLGYGTKELSSKLKEYKSLIGFRFLKSNEGEVEDFTISDVEILGAGAPGDSQTLYPLFRQVIVNQESQYHITCDDVRGKKEVDSDGNFIYYETTEENMASIMPGIYAEKDEVANLLLIDKSCLKESNYIVMWCKMSQGERKDLSVHINISTAAPIYKPQYKYIYNVIVSSNYLNVTLDVYKNGIETADWQQGSNEGVEISDPQSIDCGAWSIVKGNDDKDWQLIPLGEQVIE